MSEIEVTNAVEHENGDAIYEFELGDATYEFELDEKSTITMAELGLKLVLYCSVCGTTPEEVLCRVLEEAKELQSDVEETVAGRYEMSMPGDKDYEV